MGFKIWSSFIRDEKNLGHSKKKIFNKHFQGANSELNSLYFPRKTPWIQKNGRISRKLPISVNLQSNFLRVLFCIRGDWKGQTKRDKRSQIHSFSQIFADFCRFSLFLGITASRSRFSQKTADFRRNRFVPFSLSLLIPLFANRARPVAATLQRKASGGTIFACSQKNPRTHKIKSALPPPNPKYPPPLKREFYSETPKRQY